MREREQSRPRKPYHVKEWHYTENTQPPLSDPNHHAPVRMDLSRKLSMLAVLPAARTVSLAQRTRSSSRAVFVAEASRNVLSEWKCIICHTKAACHRGDIRQRDKEGEEKERERETERDRERDRERETGTETKSTGTKGVRDMNRARMHA